jgi:hypothetical protein
MRMPGPSTSAIKQATHPCLDTQGVQHGLPEGHQQAEDTHAAATQQHDHNKNDDPRFCLLWYRRNGFGYFHSY